MLRLTFLSLLLLPPVSSLSQGWFDMTPEGLTTVDFFRSFAPADSADEVYAWNSDSENSRGFRWNNIGWDSIFVHSSWVCDPIHGDRAQYWLRDVARPHSNPDVTLAIWIFGGCITEGITSVFRDTSGGTMGEEVFFLDDISGAGTYARIAFAPGSNELVYLAIGDTVHVSHDGGVSFSPVPGAFPTTGYVMLNNLAISPHDSSLVFVGSMSNQLFRTSDGGANWTDVFAGEVLAVEFDPNDNRILYLSTRDSLYRSEDEGMSWTGVLGGTVWTFTASNRYPRTVYAGGFGGLYRSTDAGLSWELYNDTFTTTRLTGIHEPITGDTLIVGAYDGVYGVYGSFVLSAGDEQSVVPTGFSLSQNYPNPFNAISNFGFEISDLTDVSLVVYDMLGRAVATIVNEQLAAGSYRRQWDASGQPSGIYFYRLSTSDFGQTRKLVLIR